MCSWNPAATVSLFTIGEISHVSSFLNANNQITQKFDRKILRRQKCHENSNEKLLIVMISSLAHAVLKRFNMTFKTDKLLSCLTWADLQAWNHLNICCAARSRLFEFFPKKGNMHKPSQTLSVAYWYATTNACTNAVGYSNQWGCKVVY